MSNELFSKALAESDAETQAAFLNSFYRHLKCCCKGRHDTQLCYISDALDENGREFARELAQYAALAVETRAKTETQLGELYRQKHELEKEIAALAESKRGMEPDPSPPY